MSEVALVIIYNNQFNDNINIIEELYRKRFKHIFHLVPFYMGDKKNVLPVYGKSIYFQGYIAQGFASFYNQLFEHYFFIADDLLLNPNINEKNYKEYFKLNEQSCFLPKFITLHERQEFWLRCKDAVNFRLKVRGVEAEDQLPTYEEAIKLFDKQGLQIQGLHFDQVFKKIKLPHSLNPKKITQYITYKINRIINRNRTYYFNYPLVGSYSDISIVSAENIDLFCHYCGVFAAMDLFAELALPTSIVLSSKKIVTEDDLKIKGKALWNREDSKVLDPYNYCLNKLIEDFPRDFLYLHPIKLSKWKSL